MKVEVGGKYRKKGVKVDPGYECVATNGEHVWLERPKGAFMETQCVELQEFMREWMVWRPSARAR